MRISVVKTRHAHAFLYLPWAFRPSTDQVLARCGKTETHGRTPNIVILGVSWTWGRMRTANGLKTTSQVAREKAGQGY